MAKLTAALALTLVVSPNAVGGMVFLDQHRDVSQVYQASKTAEAVGFEDVDMTVEGLGGYARQQSTLGPTAIEATLDVSAQAIFSSAASTFWAGIHIDAAGAYEFHAEADGNQSWPPEYSSGSGEVSLAKRVTQGPRILASVSSTDYPVSMTKTLFLLPGDYDLRATARGIFGSGYAQLTFRPVPEPSTFLLAALAGLGLLAFRRRRIGIQG